MTFTQAYDAIVSIAARPEHAARVAAMRRAFEERTGHIETGHIETSRVETEDFEARTRAFWDDALTRQGFAEEVRAEVGGEAAGWIRGLSRAHRGLFVRDDSEGHVVLYDVWGGGQFIVDELDAASQDALGAAVAPFDARIAACIDDLPPRLALLPGAVFHPESAAEPMVVVIAAARQRSLGTDAVLDALLRMEHSLRTLSRVKPSYAYRPAALPA